MMIFCNKKALTLTICVLMLTSAIASVDSLRELSLADAANYAKQIGVYLKSNTPAKTIEKAKSAASESLKDPDSAKFNNVRLVKYLDSFVVCGQINAKNSYGGYVGYREFLAGTQDASIIKIEKDPDYSDLADAANSGLKAACN